MSLPNCAEKPSFLCCPLLLDSAYNGVVVIDRKGIIHLYNRAARSIFNDGDRAIVGEHFRDVRPEAWPDLRRVLETGEPQIGKRIELPQATIIANRTPIRCGKEVVGVISIFQDISEYEKLISELETYRQIKGELEAIFESSYDGLYITDGQANTLRVNRAYERITGLSGRHLIGRNMKDLVKEKVFDSSVTLEVLKRKEPVTLIQRIQGRKEVMVTGSPIVNEKGKISFVVTNVRDITELNRLKSDLERARRISSRMAEYVKEQKGLERALDKIIVKSPRMIRVLKTAVQVAKTDTSVLIYGESGVGKSMLADLIHRLSPRKNKPLVRIHCGAIPDPLIESELFGYERGAFTGAAWSGKAGLVETAHGGTLVLDEVAELSLAAQVKLLEVIENKTFTRLGSTLPTRVDVRIIAATHQDLEQRITDGNFRRDLFYRLNGVPIEIPPLRERREDIMPIAFSTIEKLNRAHGLQKRISSRVLDALCQYGYPGNIRELIHIVERMFTMSEGETLDEEDLPWELRCGFPKGPQVWKRGVSLAQAVEQFEAEVIREVLKKTRNAEEAAQMLGVHYTTLWRKAKRYGIVLQN